MLASSWQCQESWGPGSGPAPRHSWRVDVFLCVAWPSAPASQEPLAPGSLEIRVGGAGGGRYLFVFPFLYLFSALRSYAADFIYIKQLWNLKLTPRQSLIIYLKSAVTPQVHLLPKDLARHVIQGASCFRKLIKLYTLSRHLSQRY